MNVKRESERETVKLEMKTVADKQDGIQFYRNLHNFHTTVSSLCPDEEHLQQGFATIRAGAPDNAQTSRKLAAVGAFLTRQQRQQLLRGALISVGNDEDKDKYKDWSTSRNGDGRPTRMNRRSSGEKEEVRTKIPPRRRHASEDPSNNKYWDHDDRRDKDYNNNRLYAP